MFRKGTIQDPDIVAVHSVSEVYEADLITGLLINSGIPAYYRDREDSGGDIFKDADTALYRTKSARLGGVAFF